jgi:hypothetical protein
LARGVATPRGILAREGEQAPVAEGVGGDLALRTAAAGWVADRRRVGVAVGVDPR